MNTAFVPVSAPLTVSAASSGFSATRLTKVNRSLQGRTTLRMVSGTPPNDEGTFGFNFKNEVLNGRAAMIGFGTGLMTEVITGKTIVEQVHLDVVPPLVLAIGLTGVWIAAGLGFYTIQNQNQMK